MKIGNTGLTAKQIAAQINRHRESSSTSQQQLAYIAKVNQSTVSRILQGHVRKMSKPLERLCNYANIEINQKPPDPAKNQQLMNALRQVWDGTESDAKVLAKLLLDLRDLRR